MRDAGHDLGPQVLDGFAGHRLERAGHVVATLDVGTGNIPAAAEVGRQGVDREHKAFAKFDLANALLCDRSHREVHRASLDRAT